MNIIEKIKESIEGATGVRFIYHAAGELEVELMSVEKFPIAYAHLLQSGSVSDTLGEYHERVTMAVIFAQPTEYDFNSIENEDKIDACKVFAFNWLYALRSSQTLRLVSVNSTDRLYDTTAEVLTGFALNVTLEEIKGYGACDYE